MRIVDAKFVKFLTINISNAFRVQTNMCNAFGTQMCLIEINSLTFSFPFLLLLYLFIFSF